MINGNLYLKDNYETDSETLQPNGVDLRLGQLYIIEDNDGCPTGIYNGHKNLPIYKPVNTKNGIYTLYPDIVYIAEVSEPMNIPKDQVQLYFPRSTLLRCGVDVRTCVGDAGYNGTLTFMMINHSQNNFCIEMNERFAQMMSFDLNNCDIEYDGDYQDDKHKEESK